MATKYFFSELGPDEWVDIEYGSGEDLDRLRRAAYRWAHRHGMAVLIDAADQAYVAMRRRLDPLRIVPAHGSNTISTSPIRIRSPG